MTPYATPAHKELTHWGRDNMATICWQHFQMHFLERNTLIAIEISLKFVPKGPIITIPALVQIMAWHWPGDKPLSEPMMVSLLMHICVTRPLWVKGAVSYRFSQGLLTLMCNNSKLKADINFFLFFCCVDKHPKFITGCKNLWFNTRWHCYSVWGKTPVFHKSGFNSETILPISIFLFDNDTYMPSPQNGIRVCQLELYFWKYFIFCIKYIFFPVFSFSS